MGRAFMVGVFVVASSGVALAQEPAAVRADTFVISGQPTTAPPGWTLHATDAATTAAPALVQAYGPGVRITTPTAVTIYRPTMPLTGDGTVGALVFVDSSTPAVYGITLGGENGLAFLVQPSGAAAIAPLHNGQVATMAWTPAPAVSMPAAGMVRPCRVDVRVQGTRAELRVNGTVAATMTIAAGALAGVPGLYTAAGQLSVVGLMIRTAAPAAGAAK